MMGLLHELMIANDNLEIVKKLNSMLELDREFTEKMVDTRYTVNDKFADSDFVCLDDGKGKCSAGLIGVLNGLIICNNMYRIAADYDNDSGKLLGFSLLELVDGKMVVVKDV